MKKYASRYRCDLLARGNLSEMVKLLKKVSIFAEHSDDTKKMINNTVLSSRNTIMGIIDEMADDVSKQIKCSSANSIYFSLATDESWNITDNVKCL